MRFLSPSRHQLEESTCGEHPNSHLVPFSVFHPLPTVYSSSSLVSLFHPTATSEIRFPRVFPAAKPTRLIALPCPHEVSKVHLLQSCLRSTSFLRPNYKALLLTAIRSTIDGVSTDTARSLLKLLTPPGFTPSALVTLPRHLHSCPSPQGSHSEPKGRTPAFHQHPVPRSVPRPRTCSSFLACS